MRQQGSVFFSSLSSTHFKKCLSNIWPVDGLLGAAGDCCVDWWWQRWLTTAVWTPVSTYWPNSLKTRLMSLETQKANPSREVDSCLLLLFTSHWAPSLICAGTDLKAPFPFDLNYLWKAVWECDTNVNKSISPVAINSTGFLFFVTKVPVCFAEVRISSINPAFVVQEEHLELLSQTLGSYAAVS